jgi:hypothetical protein
MTLKLAGRRGRVEFAAVAAMDFRTMASRLVLAMVQE